MKTTIYPLVRDIASRPWLVSNPERMAALAMDFLSASALEIQIYAEDMSVYAGDGGSVSRETSGKKRKCAVVPIHGVMTKYETCESYGCKWAANKISECAEDESYIGLVLDIDSGGGCVNAIPPLTEAIEKFKATGKPIYAHCDLCGSAAFWVASQCDAIYLDNQLSSIGSVGAYYQYVDDSAQNPQTGEKLITVYAKESTHKNIAFREAQKGNYEPAQEELSFSVAEFRKAVTSGRPSLQANNEGVLTGKMFNA